MTTAPHRTEPQDHTRSSAWRRGSRRAGLAALALASAGALVALSAPTAAVAADGNLTTVDLLDINDFHGRIEASPSTPTPKQGDVAGAAVLAGAIESYTQKNPNTLFVSAGDNVGASTFTSFVQDDQPTIEALNKAGLAVSAIGNHELDKGQSDLRDRIEPAADFDYVSSNIIDSATGKPAFDPYSIKTVGGVRIGFIGATTELIPELVSPGGIEGLEMADVVDSVNAVAKDLTDGDDSNGEADVLVLLLHEGAASATLTSAEEGDFGHIVTGVTPDVSAILSGHTHQLYEHDIVPTGGTTPRPVIQTGSYGTYLGHLQLQVDATTKQLASITAENVPLAVNGFEPDPEIAADVAGAKTVADEKGKVSLGEITGDMTRAHQTDGTENRGGESTLGNFIAEVQRSATERNGAQIAFTNPGGLRADMSYASTGAGDPDGNVSYQEAAAVQPFANTLVVLDLTGAQIKDALEQQWQPAGSSRPFLKLGASNGFSYTYDPAAAQGSRITSVTLNGTAIDTATTYKVTVNSFLATGGDNFTAFNGAAAKADSGQVDLQAQVDYFAALNGQPVAVPLDQRAVGATVSPAPEGGFAPGDEVTVKLSSLTFSTAGEQGGTVSVSQNGVALASAEIDPTIVDTTDEQGTATLTFTVPTPTIATPALSPQVGVDDPDAIVLTIAGTDQRIALPIALAAAVPGDGTDPGAGDPGAGDPGTGTPGAGDPGAGDPGTGTGNGGTGIAPVADGANGSNSGALAFTGADVVSPLIAAGLLLAAGLGVVLYRRRRAARRA